MSKFNKIGITIVLILFFVLIILLSYVFFTNTFSKSSNQEVGNIQNTKSSGTLNINKDSVLENPTKEDLQNLIDEVRSGQQDLNTRE